MDKEEIKKLAKDYFISKGFIPEDEQDFHTLELLIDAFLAGFNTCSEVTQKLK